MKSVLPIALLALPACAGAARVTTSAPSDPTAHRRAVRAEVPSRLVRVAPVGPALVIDRGDGLVRLVAGGYRIERRGDVVTAAEVTLASTITHAARAGTGWRFFTAREAFDASEFLGPVTPVGAAPRGRMGRGPGRPVALEAGVLQGVAGLPVAGTVIDAAFSDARHGAIVMEPGLAFATEDGGEFWTPVALRDDAAVAVLADDSTRWIVGTESAIALDAAGRAREIALDAVPRADASRDRRDDLAADNAIARDPIRAVTHAATRAVRDGAGRVMVFGDDATVVFDLDADTVSAQHELPCAPRVALDGGRHFAVCEDGSNGSVLFARDGAGTWSPRVRSSMAGSRCVANDDGELAACDGMCSGESLAGGVRAVCEWRADGSASSHPAEPGELVGFDNREITVVSDGTDLSALTFARGADRFRALADGVPAPSPTIDRAALMRLESDGRLRAYVAAPGGPHTAYVEGRPGGAFVLHRAPDGATGLLLGPAATALVTSGGGGLAQSVDEGDQWSPVVARSDDARARAFLAVDRDPRSVGCGDAGCVFAGTAARLGWGRVLVSSQRGAQGLALEDDGEPLAAAASWRCETTSPALRVPEIALPPAGLEAVFTEDGAAGLLVVRERPASHGGSSGGLRAEASWQGPASRGVRGTASFALERYFAPASSGATRWSLLYALATSALAVRCGAGPAGISPRCDLVRIQRRGPTEALATFAPGEQMAARWAGETAVLSIANGVAVSDGALAGTMVLVAPQGPARATPVAIARGPSGAAGPYVLDGEAGVVRVGADGAVVLEPIGELPRALTARVTSDECGPRARGAFVVRATGALVVPRAGSLEIHVLVRYGLDGDALCLRTADGPVVQLGAPGWFAASPTSNGILGTVRTRDGIAPVRCRAVPTRRGVH